MDLEKTRALYQRTGPHDLCTCDYCKNYVQQIKAAYPKVAEFLNTMGVDIEKPFETMPLEPEKGYLDYIAAQYIVLGARDDFQRKQIDDVTVEIDDCHPDTAIAEEHFVISISPIRLKWCLGGSR